MDRARRMDTGTGAKLGSLGWLGREWERITGERPESGVATGEKGWRVEQGCFGLAGKDGMILRRSSTVWCSPIMTYYSSIR